MTYKCFLRKRKIKVLWLNKGPKVVVTYKQIYIFMPNLQ